MSEQKVLWSVEQRIVIKFLGENVASAEIHHRLQQQYREECLRRRHSSPLLQEHYTLPDSNRTQSNTWHHKGHNTHLLQVRILWK